MLLFYLFSFDRNIGRVSLTNMKLSILKRIEPNRYIIMNAIKRIIARMYILQLGARYLKQYDTEKETTLKIKTGNKSNN